MARKIPLLLIISLIFILPAIQANAQDQLFGAGIRFAWDNYSKPVLVHDSGYSEGTSAIEDDAFGGPTFGGEFQVRPISRLSVGLGIDMGLAKHTIYQNTGAETDLNSEASFFKFGFLIGVKFYVIEPQVKKAALYLHLAGGKYFAKAKNELVNDTENYTDAQALAMQGQLDAVSGLNSPVVIQFAVGAEFFVADCFAIGADILGFKMGISKASIGELPEGGMWSGDHKLFTMSIYSALTMNFGFGKAKKKGGGSTAEEDGWGGAGGGGGAATSNDNADKGWGGSSGGAADTGGTPANDGWGTQPTDSGAAAPSNDGWGAAPADDGAAAPADGGWEAQPPAEEPAPSGGGSSRPKRSKPKAASPASPPPPPPGY